MVIGKRVRHRLDAQRAQLAKEPVRIAYAGHRMHALALQDG